MSPKNLKIPVETPNTAAVVVRQGYRLDPYPQGGQYNNPVMTATALDVMVLSQDGILKVEGDVRLPDSVRYRAHLEPISGEAADNDAEESWEAVQALIGFIKDGPAEPIGRDHDQYLYGYSK